MLVVLAGFSFLFIHQITTVCDKPKNNLENFGVPPDVYVENTPEDYLNGYDRELKKAIDEVNRMIDEGQYKYKN